MYLDAVIRNSQYSYHKIHAVLKESKKMKGYRAGMYKLADECCRFYPDNNLAIRYVNNDLEVDLWFESLG